MQSTPRTGEQFLLASVSLFSLPLSYQIQAWENCWVPSCSSSLKLSLYSDQFSPATRPVSDSCSDYTPLVKSFWCHFNSSHGMQFTFLYSLLYFPEVSLSDWSALQFGGIFSPLAIPMSTLLQAPKPHTSLISMPPPRTLPFPPILILLSLIPKAHAISKSSLVMQLRRPDASQSRDFVWTWESSS